MRFSIVALCFLVCACRDNAVSSDKELLEYVMDDDHGLVQHSTQGDVKIDILFRPSEQLVAQELGATKPDSAILSSLRKKYYPNFYFAMSLSKGGEELLHALEGGQAEYHELLQVLSFRMSEYVRLTTSEHDTIPVTDFLLNRTYGLARSTDILFVFSNDKVEDDEWIQFEFNEFGLGTGIKKFRFDVDDIRASPVIQY
jgi:hypothetical protein